MKEEACERPDFFLAKPPKGFFEGSKRRRLSPPDEESSPPGDKTLPRVTPLDLTKGEDGEKEGGDSGRRKMGGGEKEGPKCEEKTMLKKGRKEKEEGVTLFPGLTITPGSASPGSPEPKGDLAPGAQTPTPRLSSPGETFPRFHFGRNDDKSGLGVQLDEMSGGVPCEGPAGWWPSALTPTEVAHVSGLAEFSLPFHGLPAFCKYAQDALFRLIPHQLYF